MEAQKDNKGRLLMSRKHRKKIRVIYFLFVTLFLMSLSGYSFFYIAADVDGRVVDAETGEPVSGAVVLGMWQLQSVYVWGNINNREVIHLVEATTDVNGRYHLKGFPFKWVGTKSGHLRDSDPRVIILAKDYMPEVESSYSFSGKSGGFYRTRIQLVSATH